MQVLILEKKKLEALGIYHIYTYKTPVPTH